jgi:hypothetical protein
MYVLLFGLQANLINIKAIRELADGFYKDYCLKIFIACGRFVFLFYN